MLLWQVGTHKQDAYLELQRLQKTPRTPTPPEHAADGTPPPGVTSILAPAGSAILFDYRLIHRGAPNVSGIGPSALPALQRTIIVSSRPLVRMGRAHTR